MSQQTERFRQAWYDTATGMGRDDHQGSSLPRLFGLAMAISVILMGTVSILLGLYGAS